MSTTAYAKTRRFARVEVRLPVRLRVISADEAAELSCRLGATATSEENADSGVVLSEDESTWEHAALSAILRRLERIEVELREISGAVGLARRDRPSWFDGQTISLSGGGMGVRTHSAVSEGDLLDVELQLPGAPPASIRAVGLVVNVKMGDRPSAPLDPQRLGVAFAAIHETDRQAVVRHTFRLQRAQLREQRPSAP